MHHAANACPPSACRTLLARVAAAFALLLCLASALAGCGYHLDSPHLPNEAGTLSFAPIRNQSSTGELDIRLQDLLRARLVRHSNVNLVPVTRSDVSLTITLIDLRISRATDLTTTSVSSINYDLRGEVSLLDRRSGSYYFYRYPVAVTSRVDFDTPVVETPAIRDEGLTGILDAFSKRVETLVLLDF
jgi:hypothetical protein